MIHNRFDPGGVAAALSINALFIRDQPCRKSSQYGQVLAPLRALRGASAHSWRVEELARIQDGVAKMHESFVRGGIGRHPLLAIKF